MHCLKNDHITYGLMLHFTISVSYNFTFESWKYYMKSYWSCSKLADWIRGTKKTSAGTIQEWKDWREKAKIKSFRYWLAEEGLDSLQSVIYWPVNRMRDIWYYFKNRWIIKTHSMSSNLKRGQWYDFDDRLINSVFDEFVNFVEIELAWIHACCSQEKKKKYKISPFKRWRSPAAGIAHLEWAMELKYGEDDGIDETDPQYGQPIIY